jgi:hypothetical protein
MTIATGDAIWKFDTQDKISDASTSSVADGAKSVAADVDSTWTNSTDVVVASSVLEATFSVAPTIRSSVSLFARLLNIQSTNDASVPDANFDGIYLGAFVVDNVTSVQYIPLLDHPLPSVTTAQAIEFYIQNDTGRTLGAGWDLWVTPKTYGGAA